MSGEDALEPILVSIGEFAEWVTAVAPWVFGVCAALALIVFVLVASFILSTWREVNQGHKEMRSRMRSRGGRRG